MVIPSICVEQEVYDSNASDNHKVHQSDYILVLLSSDIHEFPTPDSICRTPSIFFLLPFTLLPALIRMVIRPQLMPTYRAGVVLVLNETKNHGWLDTLIATMMLLHSKSTYLFEGFTRNLPAMASDKEDGRDACKEAPASCHPQPSFRGRQHTPSHYPI